MFGGRYDLKRTFKNGDAYSGTAIEDGVKDGQGRYKWANGNEYNGAWKRDKMVGKGVFDNAEEGWRHEGFFADGVRHGEGVTTFQGTGAVLRGIFQGGKMHGQGQLDDPSTMSYKGEFSGGVIEGKGTATYIEGAKYDGAWCNGMWEGLGVLTTAHGAQYEGTFQRGTPEGSGRWWYTDGATYHGAIRDGELHGEGELRHADGCAYIGNFSKGKRHGFGVFTTEDSRYEGKWVDGQLTDPNEGIIVTREFSYKGGVERNERVGEGSCTWSNGQRYSGQWKDDTMHGKGKREIPGQWEYVGDHVGGLAEGYGSFTHHVERYTYEGPWYGGLKHGASGGVFRREDSGETWLGGMADDLPRGQGEWSFPDSGKYIGCVQGWSFEGQGLYKWPNGDHYNGMWHEGQRSGHGTFHDAATGDSYSGQWVAGLQHGEGVEVKYNVHHYSGMFFRGKKEGRGICKYSDGTRYDGDWVADTYEGQGCLETASYVYTGQFHQGERTGRGNLVNKKNRILYEGDVVKGLYHGKGKLHHVNGDSSEGTFLDGLRHGAMVVRFAGEGTLLYATFIKDVLDGEAIAVSRDGTTFMLRYYREGLLEKEISLPMGDAKLRVATWGNNKETTSRDAAKRETASMFSPPLKKRDSFPEPPSPVRQVTPVAIQPGIAVSPGNKRGALEECRANVEKLERDMNDVGKALDSPSLSEAKTYQLKRKYSLLRASRMKEIRKLEELLADVENQLRN